MAEPFEANYTPTGDDWTVTVVGRGQSRTATASGLIAARDHAEQLVDQLAPDEKRHRVVHLLDGDAVQFTTAYLTARLAKPEPAEQPDVEARQDAADDQPGTEPADTAAEEAGVEQADIPHQAGADEPASPPARTDAEPEAAQVGPDAAQAERQESSPTT